MKYRHLLAVLIAVLFAIVQIPLANSADTVAAKPKGVCETFIGNAKIITHNGQHSVRDFNNLVQLPAKVIDGNTIIVSGRSGNEFKVRFVAAFAPEIDKKGGTEAVDFINKQIADAGGRVVMFHDGERTADKFGRQLRLVCVVNPKGELVCLDELLIRNGLATATDGDKFYYSSRQYFKRIKPKEKPDDPDFPKYDLEDDLKYLDKPEPPKLQETNSDDVIADLFKKQCSDVQVTGSGVVTKLLADDNEGDRHQRFILKLASGQTLLVAHNIDIAPRLGGLAVGDTVKFYGEYYYNAKGGGIHWTHRSQDGKHTDGWLNWKGKMYQ